MIEIQKRHEEYALSIFSIGVESWHFCGQLNNLKLAKIQERPLRILLIDYNSSYPDVLEKPDITTLLKQRFLIIALTVFKSLYGLNLP